VKTVKYDRNIEKKNLEKTNKKLVRFIKGIPKDKLSLTVIGNSIGDGFSMSEPGELLLNKNAELINIGKSNDLVVETYQLTRSENNNSLTVFNWIMDNCSERDTYKWNKEDYKRAIKRGKPLLSEEEIDKIFIGGSNKRIQDVIFDCDKSNANIVILSLGTGSFIDMITRHGSISISNIKNSVNRDVYGIRSILELIQNKNRKNGSNTQVYLCGAPRIMNTFLTDLFMNSKIKKVGREYANVTYVPSFPRQVFYKTVNGNKIADLHYNLAEYYHFLMTIENKIIDNYFIRDLMIDLDRKLFQICNDNDINGANYSIDNIKDIIDEYAKKYESKTGNYNYFIEYIKPYIKIRYPFDFFSGSDSNNISKDLDGMKKTS
jgi:hypothetical protein